MMEEITVEGMTFVVKVGKSGYMCLEARPHALANVEELREWQSRLTSGVITQHPYEFWSQPINKQILARYATMGEYPIIGDAIEYHMKEKRTQRKG